MINVILFKIKKELQETKIRIREYKNQIKSFRNKITIIDNNIKYNNYIKKVFYLIILFLKYYY